MGAQITALPMKAEYGIFFPTKYAVAAQIKLHDLDPESCLITIAPREGEDTLRTEDILNTISMHGSTTAVIMLSGVQYYTGQYFEIEKITAYGHEQVWAMTQKKKNSTQENMPCRCVTDPHLSLRDALLDGIWLMLPETCQSSFMIGMWTLLPGALISTSIRAQVVSRVYLCTKSTRTINVLGE